MGGRANPIGLVSFIKREETHTHREHHVKTQHTRRTSHDTTETETAVMLLHVKEGQGLTATTRS